MSPLNEDLLIEIVDEFLKPFGIDSDFDSDFFYDPEDERVYFSIIISERSDRLFKEYIAKEFNFNVENTFLISLLHEVGHFYTLPLFSKEEMKKSYRDKSKIEKALEKNDDDATFSSYFDLDVEKVATKWAIEYYQTHTKRCDEFFKKFLRTLVDEYMRLGVI